jgi:hypothetical protein
MHTNAHTCPGEQTRTCTRMDTNAHTCPGEHTRTCTRMHMHTSAHAHAHTSKGQSASRPACTHAWGGAAGRWAALTKSSGCPCDSRAGMRGPRSRNTCRWRSARSRPQTLTATPAPVGAHAVLVRKGRGFSGECASSNYDTSPDCRTGHDGKWLRVGEGCGGACGWGGCGGGSWWRTSR